VAAVSCGVGCVDRYGCDSAECGRCEKSVCDKFIACGAACTADWDCPATCPTCVGTCQKLSGMSGINWKGK